MYAADRPFLISGRKQEQIVKFSNLLSAKPGEVALAAEKQKEELQAKSYLNVSLYRQLIEAWSKEYPESENPVLLLERRAFSGSAAGTGKSVLSGQERRRLLLACGKRRRLSICADKQTGGSEELSKTLNSRLNGRGGGSSQMAQGTFFASREAVEQVFWEELNGIK